MYNIHRRNFTLRGGAPCTPLASIPLKEGRNMEHTIGFPNLGLEFTLNRVACTVLGKDIYWYGIIICAGFILAALYVNSRTKDFGITSDNLTDCLIICVPLGIICARIYYVVFEWGYYAQHPGEIIAIWKGGIAIYGGIIGTLIGLFVYPLEPRRLCPAAFLFEKTQVQGRDRAALCRMVRRRPRMDRGPAHGQPVYRLGPRLAAPRYHQLYRGGRGARAAVSPD